MRPKIPASTAAPNKVMIAGTFRAINAPVKTGTRSNHGEILNVDLRLEEKSAIIPASDGSCNRLTTRNITIEITNDAAYDPICFSFKVSEYSGNWLFPDKVVFEQE